MAEWTCRRRRDRFVFGVPDPAYQLDPGTSSVPSLASRAGPRASPGARHLDLISRSLRRRPDGKEIVMKVSTPLRRPRVHKDTVVAAIRLAESSEVQREVRTFATTTPALLDLSAWLDEHACTMSPWRRPASTAPGLAGPRRRQPHPDPGQCAMSRTCPAQDRRRRRGLALRPARPRPDPRQLRPEAQTRRCATCCAPASNWSASRPATSSASEDPRGGQPQARLGAHRHHGPVRSRRARRAGSRRARSGWLQAHGQPAVKAAPRRSGPRSRAGRGSPPFPARCASTPVRRLGRAIAEIDAQVERDLGPFREAVKLLVTIPGISDLTAQVILSEIAPT